MNVVRDSDWFVVYAQGHHGYPQPENESWEALVYEAGCLRCGVHGPQRAGFRLRRSNRAPHSHFRQINWVFDAWFVRPAVEAALRAANLSGLVFRDAIDHESGAPLEETRQLVVSTILDGADTTRLQSVTCRPNNEEGSPLGGPMRYPQKRAFLWRGQAPSSYAPGLSKDFACGRARRLPDLSVVRQRRERSSPHTRISSLCGAATRPPMARTGARSSLARRIFGARRLTTH